MSEFAPPTPEKLENYEDLKVSAEHLLPAEDMETQRSHERDPAEVLRAARADIQAMAQSETQPSPLERLQAREKPAEPASTRTRPDAELRGFALRRELNHVQRKLPGNERVFSKVIHQPAIRAVSESAAKTVSRPSGLLGGGLVALLGTTGYLYLAKHLGFTYNYLVFLLLLVAGFCIGLLLEFLIQYVSRRRLM